MSEKDPPNDGESFVSFRRHARLPDVFYALTASGASWMFTCTGGFRAGVPCAPSDAASIAGGLSMTREEWVAAGFPAAAPPQKIREVPAPERRCENCTHWVASMCDVKWSPKSSDTKARAEACGYWDPITKPRSASIPENPVAAVEDELRATTAANAGAAIQRLSALLGGPAPGAARALHLISELSSSYGTMLATIGVPGVSKPHRRGGQQSGLYQVGPAEPLMAGSTNDMEILPGGETYGNQAMQQFNAGLKQIVELAAGRKDKPSKPKGPTAFDIESLTRAYGNAKRENLDPEIVDKLKSRLEEALAAQEWGPVSVDPDDLSVAPIPVAPLLEGVARGVAAQSGLPITDEGAGALGATAGGVEEPT